MPTMYLWSSGDLLECLVSPQGFLAVGREDNRAVKLVQLSSLVSLHVAIRQHVTSST